MGVRVVYLGRLRDTAGCEHSEAEAPLDWKGLLDHVPEAVAGQLAGDRVHIACAGKVLADKTALAARDGDEVALLPPVSRG